MKFKVSFLVYQKQEKQDKPIGWRHYQVVAENREQAIENASVPYIAEFRGAFYVDSTNVQLIS